MGRELLGLVLHTTRIVGVRTRTARAPRPFDRPAVQGTLCLSRVGPVVRFVAGEVPRVSPRDPSQRGRNRYAGQPALCAVGVNLRNKGSLLRRRAGDRFELDGRRLRLCPAHVVGQRKCEITHHRKVPRNVVVLVGPRRLVGRPRVPGRRLVHGRALVALPGTVAPHVQTTTSIAEGRDCENPPAMSRGRRMRGESMGPVSICGAVSQ